MNFNKILSSLISSYWGGKFKSFLSKIITFIKISLKKEIDIHGLAVLITAIATLALVYVTYLNLDSAQQERNVAREMSVETKRLADETRRLVDLGIRQFQIRSYPVFLIEQPEIHVDSNSITQIFKIQNKGDIAAHNVTFLFVNIHKKDNIYIFTPRDSAYYESESSEDKVTTINFEKKLLKDTARTVIIDSVLPQKYTIDDLLYCLIYIRFKIPYDEKYNYEYFGFIKKDKLDSTQNDQYLWQDITVNDTLKLMSEYFNLRKGWSNLITKFFVDFDITSFLERQT